MSLAVESNSTASPRAGVCKIVLDGKRLVECLGVLQVGDDVTDIWLDFAHIKIINSHELSALIRFSLRVRQMAKSIAMCNVGPALHELFEITRFGRWHEVIEVG